jgi:hypothetical protein
MTFAHANRATRGGKNLRYRLVLGVRLVAAVLPLARAQDMYVRHTAPSARIPEQP